jgi:uncharacterized membrane protein YkoI
MLLALPAYADEASHDRALAARRAGAIVPLGEILEVVAARVPGSPIEIELKERNGRYLYEVEVLTPEGMLVHMEVDAHDKQILDSHSKQGDQDPD